MKRTTLIATAAMAGLTLFTSAATAQFNFGSAVNYLVGTRPSGAAAGDFDGDGDIDLATTVDNPDRIVILINDGFGGYTLGAPVILPASSSPNDVLAGDLDGDGDIDMAVLLRDNHTVMAVINQGGGVFVQGSQGSVGDNARGMDMADHDGDGDLDIIVANRDDNTATVLTNSGSATFGSATLAAGDEPRAAAFGDFDGDGDMDAAVTNHDARTISVYTNTGGSFALSAKLSVGSQLRPEGIVAADLDADGDTDIAVAANGNGFEVAAVFLNAGGFSGFQQYASSGQDTSKIIAADMDCDGLMELITSNGDSNNISVLHNLGGGAFGPAMLIATGTRPERVTAADLDGDADPDLVIPNRDSNDLSVVLNDSCDIATIDGDLDGDGIVGPSDLAIVLGNWGPCPGCPADFNGDGVVGPADLAVVLGNWG